MSDHVANNIVFEKIKSGVFPTVIIIYYMICYSYNRMILKCWEYSAKDRPTFTDIVCYLDKYLTDAADSVSNNL